MRKLLEEINNPDFNFEEWKKRVNEKLQNKSYKRFKVMCLDTGVVYDNAKKAAEAIDAPRSAMSNHLNGKGDTIYGRRYKRVEEQPHD